MDTLARSDAAPCARTAPSSSPARTRGTVALVVIAAFLVVNATGLIPFRALAGDLTGWPRMAALAVLGYGHYLAVPLLVARWLRGPGQALRALGLDGSPVQGFAFAFACSAIVVLGIAATAPPLALERLPLALARTAVLPGIAEELLFRAFLFGFLFRFAGWGFLPAALLSSIVFGIEHLYQGRSAVEAAGVLLLTGVGGVWWSWLLVEWRWNLWVPIAFHVLLNGYWTAFDVADNALGGALEVGLRLACMLLSIGATIVLARRRGGLQVTGRRWWAPPG